MRGAVPCLYTDLTTRAVPHFIQALQMGRRAEGARRRARDCGDERVNRDAAKFSSAHGGGRGREGAKRGKV